MKRGPGSEHGRRRRACGFTILGCVLTALVVVCGAGRLSFAQKAERASPAPAPAAAPAGGDKAESTEVLPALPPVEKPELPPLAEPKQDYSNVKFIKEKGEILYSDVTDHNYGFDEAPLYFTLKVCRDLPREFFTPGPPDKEMSFSQLTSMPNGWRGKPVTISALVGGAAKWEVPQPELVGLDHFWKVETHKKSSGNLAEVFTLLLVDNPGDLPAGTPIRVKGYFYKIRDYEKEHFDPERGENVAVTYSCPVIIGRYLQRAAETPRGTSAAGNILETLPKLPLGTLAITVGGVLVMVAIVFFFVRRTLARQHDLHPIKPKEELSPEELAKRVKFLEEQEKSGGTAPGGA